MRLFRCSAGIWAAWLCWVSTSQAQVAEATADPAGSTSSSEPDGTSNASALAEELFRQARAAWEAGRFEEACAKFRESRRVEASPGTILNVARCEAREGRVASAWASYLKAARMARAAGRESIVVEGEARAAELESRLSFITVRVERPAEGQVVRLGRHDIGLAAYGTRLPVDPGMHLLTARAKGRAEWHQQVEVKEGESLVAQVPPLAPLAPAPSSGHPSNPWPWVLGGSGIAFLAGGFTTALLAKGAYDAAERLCPLHVECGSDAIEKSNQANALANVSNVLVPIGALALGAGITWLILQPKQEAAGPLQPKVALEPLGEGGALARVGGRF